MASERRFPVGITIIITVCAFSILCVLVTHQNIFFRSSKSSEKSENEYFKKLYVESDEGEGLKQDLIRKKGSETGKEEILNIAGIFKAREEKYTTLKTGENPPKVRIFTNDQKIEELSRPKYRLRRSTGIIEQLFPDFTFSEWSSWSECDSTDCGLPGQQWKTRNCYGTNIEEREIHPCKYDNLVKSRPCYPIDCENITRTEIRWSKWTKWSECSISCGRGGGQTRFRNCYIDEDRRISLEKCPGKTREKRSCQYSVTCPMWDSWSSWSECSRSCGEGGVMYRQKRCVAYKYFTVYEDTEENVGEGNNRVIDELDTQIGISVEQNKTSFMKSNMYKHEVGMTILLNGDEVFIVDAIKLSNMKISNVREEEQIKVMLESEKCPYQEARTTEKKICVLHNRCLSRWSAWSKWTLCRPRCGVGMSKRERKCIRNEQNEPCSGRKFLYRRCYSNPCWSPWVEVEPCSATCGAGLVKRSRKCRSTITPPYKCIGPHEGYEKCKLKPCADLSWSNWSEFSECTASCNSGLMYRNRTCIKDDCQGPSNDVRLCNRQRCPTWGRWGPFTCCSVTCGRGIRKRKRGCERGNVGDQGCNGTTTELNPCYLPPCQESIQQSSISVFENTQCGIRPRAMLKNIAILRIFGGKKSVPNSWPWQASWQHRIDVRDNRWKHKCGGSLIHPRWVATAAHCINDTDFPVRLSDPGLWWSVVLGMDQLYEDGSRYFTEEIFVNEKYLREVVPYNDIALIKLQQMVPITDKISPICLPGIRKPEPGQKCITSGWGVSGSNTSYSKKLLEANVPVVSFAKCQTVGEYYRLYLSKKTHMCAGNPVNVTGDSCRGDSGGPLSCKSGTSWYLAGVTSFGFATCGTPGNLGIYTDVGKFQDWIINITKLHTYDEC